jgi:hypothetical protein
MATRSNVNHRNTGVQRLRAQRHHTITPPQAQRRQDAKNSRRHRNGDSLPTGRGVTASSRASATKMDPCSRSTAWTWVHLRRSRASGTPTRPRLIGGFRHTTPFPIQRERKTSLHVTLSEGVRRPSRRVPLKHEYRRSLGATPIFGRSFDSLCSLRMTRDWATPCGRDARTTMRVRSFVVRASRLHRTPPRRRDVGATKVFDSLNSRLQSRLGIDPLRHRQGGAVVACARRAVGSTGRDKNWFLERPGDAAVAAVGDRSQLRRPRTPSRLRAFVFATLRCPRWHLRLSALSAVPPCDGAMPLWFNCDGCDGSNQMRCCDDFVCDAFAPPRLRACDVAMPAMASASICVICDSSLRWCDASVVQLRWMRWLKSNAMLR